MYGDGEPHLCPTGLTSDVQPGSLTLTATTATWSYTISQPDYIWGFKVRRTGKTGPCFELCSSPLCCCAASDTEAAALVQYWHRL